MSEKCVVCEKPVKKASFRFYCDQCRPFVNRVTAKASIAVRAVGIVIQHDAVCVDCGEHATELDHRHYGKPLDVVPVCKQCNRKRGHALDIAQCVNQLKREGFTPARKILNDRWLESQLDSLEHEYIMAALERVQWNRTAAARLLGITFRAMRYRIERLGIS